MKYKRMLLWLMLLMGAVSAHAQDASAVLNKDKSNAIDDQGNSNYRPAEQVGVKKIGQQEACYRDNLHSIWAGQELYRKGNSREIFFNILQKNMQPVYDSARRQGYEVWDF